MAFSKPLELLRQRQNLPLLAVFALGMVLRFWFIGHESLWLDEINTLLVATTHGYPETLQVIPRTAAEFYNDHLAWQPANWEILIRMLSQNVHMPLYYLLLNPWLGLFGMGEESIRGFSAMFSIGMLLPLYFLGQSLSREPGTGSRIAFWAVFIAAVSPFQLYYAQEARMYTMALFWTATCGLALWKLLFDEEAKPRWAAIYTVSLLAGVFSHYIFFFQLPFHALIAALVFLKKPGKRLAWFLPAAILLGIALSLWYPIYVEQRSGILDLGDHFSDGRMALIRYLGMFGWEPLIVVSGSVDATQLFYIPLCILLFAFRLYHYGREGMTLRAGGFILLWILVPLFAQFVVDWVQETHTLTIERYTMLIAPAVYLLLGSSLARLPDKLAKARAVLAAVMVLIALSTVWPGTPLHYKEKFATREIAGYLATEARPESDVILVNGPLAAPCTLAYYLKDDLPRQPILYWVSSYGHQGALPPPDTALLDQYDRAWLFLYRGNKRRGAYVLRDILKAHYRRADFFLGPRKRLALYSQTP
jgi:mannosyltransferase